MRKSLLIMGTLLAGIVLGGGIAEMASKRKTDSEKELSDKHLALFLMMTQWVKIKQDGKSLADYFEKNGLKKIAVYGMSYVGDALIKELKDTGISVLYGIDQSAKSVYADIDVVTMEEKLAPVNAVIVTAITFFDEIKEKLSEKINCPIISLEDILYEI